MGDTINKSPQEVNSGTCPVREYVVVIHGEIGLKA